MEGTTLTWDLSAILSIISFGYACGDRTLIKGIKRQPWLSTINQDHTVTLEAIPPHDLYWDSPKNIAKNLRSLLEKEAISVCKDQKDIYILLSGGLDSRIVAGILIDLYNKEKILTKPKALTWGLDESRDVVYAKAIAKILGIELIHIGLSPDHLIDNIYASAKYLGSLVSPYHLHRMLWCQNLPGNALVLNGSYGDSIGRAVYSSRHILERNYLSPKDPYQLLNPSVLAQALPILRSDLEAEKKRSETSVKYVAVEHMMQSQYMRGLIAHAMSIIGNFCNFYSMFTSPEVYSYMWSIHPSARNDKVYANLLNNLNKSLLEIPWAKTNKAIMGETRGARADLRKEFHDYESWTKQLLDSDFSGILDPKWFKDTGVFNAERIENFRLEAQKDPLSFRYDLPLWLCSFRILAEKFQDLGKELKLSSKPTEAIPMHPSFQHQQKVYKIRLKLRNSKLLAKVFRITSKIFSKATALFKFPPKKMN